MKTIIPITIEFTKSLCDTLGHYNFAELQDIRVGKNSQGKNQIVQFKLLDDIVTLFLDNENRPFLSVNSDESVQEKITLTTLNTIKFTIPSLWKKNIGKTVGIFNVLRNNAFVKGVQVEVDQLDHISAVLIHFADQELSFFTVHFDDSFE